MKKRVKVYAPATSANISVGFDMLGAAINPIDGAMLGDVVIVEQADSFQLVNSGKFVKKLPKNPKHNIVYRCWLLFCKNLGKDLPVKITLEKNMPIGSGLGSSACSIVGALVALNEFFDSPFNPNQMLSMMGELEGVISGSIHYDNVAPCYLGGLQLILDEMPVFDKTRVISEAIPYFDDWYWVMAYPGIKVSTAEARAILPSHYTKQDCVDHGRFTAGFVHACYSRKSQLAAAMLHDHIAEPYRKSLLPNFEQIKRQAGHLGALAAGISGSGPTIFVITDKLAIAEKMELWLQENYLQNPEGFTYICKIDSQGARVIEMQE